MNENFLFDKAVFHELCAELGTADAIEVLMTFLADTASKLAAIEANSEARPAIKREAHSMKSSAATFGFQDLSRLARELEYSAETMAPVQLQQSIAGLRRAFENTERFAQANLLDNGPGTAI
jgi:HPt (histidine-containing phosphotransfer) domain-containing protein